MANKTFQGRIVQKHDTEANWKKATNFIPLKGEIIIYDDLKKIKIGDGTTTVGNLAFSNDLDTLATIAKTGSYNDLTNKPYYLIEYNSTNNTINHTYDEINTAYQNNQELIVKDSVTNDIYTFSMFGQTYGDNIKYNETAFNFIKITTVNDRQKMTQLNGMPEPFYFTYKLLVIDDYGAYLSNEIPLESSNSFYFKIYGAGNSKGRIGTDYNTLIKKYKDNKFIYAMADYMIGSAASQGLVYLKEYNPTTKALVFEGIVEDYIYILTVNSDGTITQDYHSKYLIGATDTTDGTSGLIPTPKAGDQGKFLRGDATWADVTIPTKLSDLTDDVVDGNYLPLTGGTLTGSLTLPAGYLSFNDAIKLSGGISSNVPRLTITSALDKHYTIIKGVGWPEDENDAANRKYVDNQIAANASSTIIKTWTDDGT